MIKPYRIKHLPTGLYYRPWNGISMLSEKGKIYQSGTHGLTDAFKHNREKFTVRLSKRCKIAKKVESLVKLLPGWSSTEWKIETNTSDWIKEEL